MAILVLERQGRPGLSGLAGTTEDIMRILGTGLTVAGQVSGQGGITSAGTIVSSIWGQTAVPAAAGTPQYLPPPPADNSGITALIAAGQQQSAAQAAEFNRQQAAAKAAFDQQQALSDKKSSQTWQMVGLIAGGVVGLSVLGGVAYLVLRKKRRR